MHMNTIIFQLCQEDRDRLDRIIAGLERGVPEGKRIEAHQPEPAEVEGQMSMEDIPLTTPEEKPAEAQETAKEEPAVSKADIQKKVVTLSAAGKKVEVKKIVTEYATKVSDIPEEKLAEVWQKLTALEG
jgi:hypothetical protein